MQKIIFSILFATLFLGDLLIPSQTWCWDDEVTHKSLTEHASKFSIINTSNGSFLKNIGLTDGLNEILLLEDKTCDDKSGQTVCNVLAWLRYGAEKEDEGKYLPYEDITLRYLNHFHNPLCDDPSCDFGGLDDGILSKFSHGQSALLWAQDSDSQAQEIEGDQSWKTVRKLFSEALTAVNDNERQAKFAQMFKGLGHQMHLVQDMAVPAHVRNDAHPEYSLWRTDRDQWADSPKLPLFFEPWAKDKRNQAKITAFAAGAQKPALNFSTSYLGDPTLSPVSQLWDANTYNGSNPSGDWTQGLSEYTNANFFSDDTIFAAETYSPGDPHYFPYPKQTSTTLADVIDLVPELYVGADGQQAYKLYLAKREDGESIHHFLRVGYFSYAIPPSSAQYNRTFYLDEACHEDYAEKLVPRAVGYSAALLDYFFRGTMQIRRPFVKLASDGTDIFIGGFEFEVKNTSMIGDVEEELKRGSLDLVYRYIPATVTPPENGTPPEPDDNATSPEPVYGLVGPEQIFNKATGAPYSIDSSNADINSEFVRLSVDLAPELYIPRDATELSFMLVYSGTLGHELNTAVAVGSHRFDQASLADKTRFLFDGQILYGHTPGTPVPGLTYPINLYTVLADGDDLRPLTDVDTTPVTNAPYLAYFQPAWSPDGRLIAYRKNYCSAGGRTELFETPWIGCNDHTEDNHPDRYLYVSDLSGGSIDVAHPMATFSLPSEGNPENRLSSLFMPSFAPDSHHVLGVLLDNHSMGMSLVVFDIGDGAGACVGGFRDYSVIVFSQMWSKQFYGSTPAWSPDGEKIVYYVNQKLNDAPIGFTYPKDIFTLAPSLYRDAGQLFVDGFNDMPLTSDDYLNTQPSWSPDSRWLVFTSNRDHHADDATKAMDIWIMDRDGQNMKRIYNGQYDCMNPSFSPDGTRIAFLEGGGAICTVALDGSDYRVIVSANSISDSQGDVLRDILAHLSWSPYLGEFAPTVTLQADSVTIAEGETVTLTWSSTGADRIVLDNGLGEQTQMNGDIDITPTASATYTVTAYNWAGKATASVSVAVE